MKRHYFLLILVLIFSFLLDLTGINWGLPSEERTDLAFPAVLRTDGFYFSMKEARDRIYSLTEGSPIGILRSGAGATAVKLSIGLNNNDEPLYYFSYRENILANFIRPYLIRSNNPDEQMTIAALSNINPKKLAFDPHLYHFGGAYIYSTGLWLGIGQISGLLRLTPDIVYYMKNPREMAKIFIAGRLLSAMAIVLSCFIVYQITRRLYGPRAAVLAAILFALSPAMIIQAHIMKPYALATLFSLFAIYFCTFFAGGKTSDYLLCGLFLGLAAGCSYTYLPLILVPASYHYFYTRTIFDKNMAFVILVALLVFISANIYCFLNPHGAYSEFILGKSAYPLNLSFSSSLNVIKNTLKLGLREFVPFVALGGAIYILIKRDIAGMAMLVSLTLLYPAYSLILSDIADAIATTRFLLPYFAMIIIIAAHWIDVMLDNRYRKIVLVIFSVVVLQLSNYSLAYTLNFYIDSTGRSTRLTAGKWIMKELKDETSIGLLAMPEPSHVPPFDFTRYRITVIGKLKAVPQDRLPAYIIVRSIDPENLVSMNNNYELIKCFPPVNPLLANFNDNEITHSNFPIRIYKKKGAIHP